MCRVNVFFYFYLIAKQIIYKIAKETKTISGIRTKKMNN